MDVYFGSEGEVMFTHGLKFAGVLPHSEPAAVRLKSDDLPIVEFLSIPGEDSVVALNRK